MIKNLAFVFCFALASNHVYTQVVLVNLHAYQLNEKIQLNWTLDAGGTCNGIQVYRSGNGVDFNMIGEIDGICGSVFEPQQFVFDDPSPLPFQTNYYKIITGDGQQSHIIWVDFAFVSSGYFYVENPVNSGSLLYLKQGEKFKLAFYTKDGKKVLETQPASDIVYIGNFISQLPKGILFLYIEAENGTHVSYRLLNP